MTECYLCHLEITGDESQVSGMLNDLRVTAHNACALNHGSHYCQACRTIIWRENGIHRYATFDYCEDCYNETFTCCDRCGLSEFRGGLHFDERSESNLCESCYNAPDPEENEPEESNAIETIEVGNPNLLKPSGLGPSDTFNAFGVELEANVKDGGRLPDFWKTEEDGSLNEDTGVEFISGILPKREGVTVVKVFEEWADKHLSVDKACGYHLHLFIHPNYQRLRELKRILIAYQKFEPFWFSLVSASRRDNNRYAQQLKLNVEGLAAARTYCQLLREVYKKRIRQLHMRLDTQASHKYAGPRYLWVNIHSILHRNTIEIRLHQGTVNAKKILYWYYLHRSFMRWAIKQHVTTLLTLSLEELKAMWYMTLNHNLKKYIALRQIELNEGQSAVNLTETFNWLTDELRVGVVHV